MDFEKMRQYINNIKTRSAWERGVKEYAFELLDELEEHYNGGYITDEELFSPITFREALLNGAKNWYQYSYGGCSLITNYDIAERLCTPSEFKRKREGALNPNKDEDWCAVQARALTRAAFWVRNAYEDTIKEN